MRPAELIPISTVGAMIRRFGAKGKTVRDSTDTAAPHWRRYRRLMALMLALAVTAIATALAVLHHEGVVMHLNFVIAMGLGIGVSLLLAGALMGLVFVSANSGHDDAVERHNLPTTEQGRPEGRP